MTSLFLPGVPEAIVRDRLARAGGNEIASGKFASPESSAALAVNTFGWFIDRPALMPPLPGLDDLDWPAVCVDVERCMRFPWAGGRHPWLDATVETGRHLIGVESKRFEPFRDTKAASLAAAYDRDVWGREMAPFTAMRDALRAAPSLYVQLDAAQLVKHALGLVTEGGRVGKRPILFYLFAEPTHRAGQPIAPAGLALHRAELADFAGRVAGACVRFGYASYREWLTRFDAETRSHAVAITGRFDP